MQSGGLGRGRTLGVPSRVRKEEELKSTGQRHLEEVERARWVVLSGSHPGGKGTWEPGAQEGCHVPSTGSRGHRGPGRDQCLSVQASEVWYLSEQDWAQRDGFERAGELKKDCLPRLRGPLIMHCTQDVSPSKQSFKGWLSHGELFPVAQQVYNKHS